MNRVTVSCASKMLGVSQQCIRVLMQQGKLPIGTAIKNSKNTGYLYLIYKEKIDSFIGNDGLTKLGEIIND